MKKYFSLWMIMFFVLVPSIAQVPVEPFKISWDWRKQSENDRNTSMLVTFNNSEELTADHARGFNGGDVYLGELGKPGKWGSSLGMTKDASIGHFRGDMNINSHHGTVGMWVKSNSESNIWDDNKEHWLAAIQGDSHGRIRTLGLYKRAEDNAMVLFEAPNWGGRPERSIVYNPGKLAADQWHHILFSWDREKGQLWLTVNGTGITGVVGESFSSEPFFILWLGSSGHERQSFAPLNGFIDQLRVSDCTVEARNWLETKTQKVVDVEALSAAEQTLRRWFGFMELMQSNGGWANCYTYPTLLPSATGSRQLIRPDGYVVNDKGHIGPAACWLIYASEVLREPWYIHIAERTAQSYLSAQYPEGCWDIGYWAEPDGLIPESNQTKVKLQDQNQVHPMYLLLYLYRLTGKNQYLEGAKKAGEFFLKAQNPNGSWSHSFNLKKGIGESAKGYPQGGEINDNACDDGMTAMLMMYHFTKENKYLEAYVRCADWFLESQLGPPTWGWAMQYDADNNPVWARGQEPPSMAIQAGYIATTALRQAFWITGDSKYLEAPKKFFQWMINASKEREYSSWYDLKTGRPIVSAPEAPGQIFFIDEPVELEKFMKISVKIDYAKKHKRDPEGMLEQINKDLKSKVPPEWAPEPDLKSAAQAMPDYVEKIYYDMETQNELGGWVSKGQGERFSAGSVIWTRQNRILEMLKWVENARMLTGELPPVFRGKGVLESCAYPYNDWYDTPLRKNNF